MATHHLMPAIVKNTNVRIRTYWELLGSYAETQAAGAEFTSLATAFAACADMAPHHVAFQEALDKYLTGAMALMTKYGDLGGWDTEPREHVLGFADSVATAWAVRPEYADNMRDLVASSWWRVQTAYVAAQEVA